MAVDVEAGRVFRSAEEGVSQADIANAIDHLSRAEGADLLNLLGADAPS